MTRVRGANRQTRYHRSRIQRNRRPDYAYVNPIDLRPPKEARTVARAQVSPSARVRTPAMIEMVKEYTTPYNVYRATTVTLLRMRARTQRAQYERYMNVLNEYRSGPFVWSSPEGDGTVAYNEQRLREYIESHVYQIQRLRNRIESCPDAKDLLSRANRFGGSRHRTWEGRNEAVYNELL